jgi:hypothetical protein
MDRDVLGHAFIFLTLSELHHANAVARRWTAAVAHMPPLNGRKPNDLTGQFVMTGEVYRARASSVLLRRHVARLQLLVTFPTPPLPVDTEPPFDFPPNLLSLRVCPTPEQVHVDHAAPLQTLLTGVRGCVRLEYLEYCYSPKGSFPLTALLDLRPLVGLQRLKHLSLGAMCGEVPSALTAEQVDVIRQLRSLTRLHVCGGAIDEATFQMLMRAPFQLALVALPINKLTEGHTAAITYPLPSLDKFCPSSIETSSVAFLRFLPSIRTLTLSWQIFSVSPPPAGDLLAGLRHCSRVTELKLQQGPRDFDASHLAGVLQAMPLLQALTIQTAPQLTSLAPFAEAGPHQSRLQQLILSRVGVDRRLPPIRHLYSLGALQTLILSDTTVLTPDLLEELRPSGPTEASLRWKRAITSLTRVIYWN